MIRFCVICGYQRVPPKTRSLFAVPKDLDTQKSWESACGRVLKVGTYVCSEHFSPEDILRNRVREGAVPHIICSNKPSHHDENLPDDIENGPNTDSLFSGLMSGEEKIDLPQRWGVHKLTTTIIFSKIKSDDAGNFDIDRSVLVTSHFVEARVLHKRIMLGSIVTAADLQEYITKFDRNLICNGESRSCSVFLNLGRARMCTNCYRCHTRKKLREKRIEDKKNKIEASKRSEQV